MLTGGHSRKGFRKRAEVDNLRMPQKIAPLNGHPVKAKSYNTNLKLHLDFNPIYFRRVEYNPTSIISKPTKVSVVMTNTTLFLLKLMALFIMPIKLAPMRIITPTKIGITGFLMFWYIRSTGKMLAIAKAKVIIEIRIPIRTRAAEDLLWL